MHFIFRLGNKIFAVVDGRLLLSAWKGSKVTCKYYDDEEIITYGTVTKVKEFF
ncbi:MAG: hypothetical protein M1470_07530 [Bacteroidetes bacterium]|nr:hypothetical protein [Bacteroidota bacterium]